MLTEEMEPCSWFRAFNFFSYNNAPQFGERREILNDHTLFLETRINVSGVTSGSESRNTWGRGHANYLCSAKSFLDSLFGDLNAFSRFKSRKRSEESRRRIEESQRGIEESQRGIEESRRRIEESQRNLRQLQEESRRYQEEQKRAEEEQRQKETTNFSGSKNSSGFKKFGIGSLIASAVLAVGYGIYKGVKKFINKKPAVKTKSLEKVKNLV